MITMASPIPSNIPPTEKTAHEHLPPSYAPYEPPSYFTLPHFYTSPAQQRRSVIRRFLPAFAFALVIWLLTTVLVHSVLVVTRFNAAYVSHPSESVYLAQR